MSAAAASVPSTKAASLPGWKTREGVMMCFFFGVRVWCLGRNKNPTRIPPAISDGNISPSLKKVVARGDTSALVALYSVPNMLYVLYLLLALFQSLSCTPESGVRRTCNPFRFARIAPCRGGGRVSVFFSVATQLADTDDVHKCTAGQNVAQLICAADFPHRHASSSMKCARCALMLVEVFVYVRICMFLYVITVRQRDRWTDAHREGKKNASEECGD